MAVTNNSSFESYSCTDVHTLLYTTYTPRLNQKGGQVIVRVTYILSKLAEFCISESIYEPILFTSYWNNICVHFLAQKIADYIKSKCGTEGNNNYYMVLKFEMSNLLKVFNKKVFIKNTDGILVV